MKEISYLLLLFFLTINTNAYSSGGNTKGVIKAVLRDAKTNSPIEYANVTIHNSKDSSFINGTVSDKNGELAFYNLPEGEYYVKISYIGYEKKYIPGINISLSKNEVSLGIIKLDSEDYKLDAINVVGEKASEELHLDKKVINVAQNISATGGTALDVLQNQPSVQVDQDGNVSLRGNSNFTVQINGRPSPLQGSDALRQVSANMIESIELITNPSAKYDSEGSAGIINIILKKQIDNSTSGIINAGAGSRNKYNGDFTINYKNSDYSLMASVDYRRNTNLTNQYFDRFLYSNSGSLNTDLAGRFQRDNFNLKIGLDYNLSDNSTLSYSASYGLLSLDRDFKFSFEDLNSFSNGFDKYSFTDDFNNLDAKFFNSAIYLSKQFTPKVEEINFEISYTNVDLPSTQSTTQYDADIYFNPVSSTPVRKELNNNTKRNEGRIKLNYFHTIGERGKIEGGLQTNLFYRNYDIKEQNYNYDFEQWFINPNASNQFDFRNNVYSAFVMYTNQLYGFDYQIGLRAEQTDRILEQKTLGSNYEYNKLHFFPSLNISTKITEEQQIQFGYSRRINRPFEFALNPFPNFSDSYVYSIGNPGLLPELTNSFELNYQRIVKGLFISIQTYYRNSANSFTQTITLDADNRTKLSFGNIETSNVYGAEISSSITLIPWLKIDPSINLFNSEISGFFENEFRTKKMFAWSSRLNTTVSFSPNTRFQIMFNYVGKQQDLQNTVDPIVFLTMSLRQDLFDKKLSVSLIAQNLFNTGRFNLISSGNNFNMIGKIRPEAPVLRLNLSYNFNNFKNTSKAERVDLNVNEGL